MIPSGENCCRGDARAASVPLGVSKVKVTQGMWSSRLRLFSEGFKTMLYSSNPFMARILGLEIRLIFEEHFQDLTQW